MPSFFKLSLSIFFTLFTTSNLFANVTDANDRPIIPLSEINRMDNNGIKADLCPKNAIEHKYLHRMILIDSTMGLKGKQISLIKRLLLGEDMLRRMVPYDRLSIVRLNETSPQYNLAAYSMCRPRNGDINSPYKIDKHDWMFETKKELEIQFKRFKDGVDDTLNNINSVALPENDPKASSGSPIMEQIKEISRLPDFKFDSFANYQKRELIIISDLQQNTTKIPFYKYCKLGKNQNCPSYEDFKKQKKITRWLKKALPDFGENINIKFFYLNTVADPNLDREVLEFWEGYFNEVGIKDFDYEIESDSNI